MNPTDYAALAREIAGSLHIDGMIEREEHLLKYLHQARVDGFVRCREMAANIANERSIVCDEKSKSYAKTNPDEKYWTYSERCAEREATHIAISIHALTPDAALTTSTDGASHG